MVNLSKFAHSAGYDSSCRANSHYCSTRGTLLFCQPEADLVSYGGFNRVGFATYQQVVNQPRRKNGRAEVRK